MRTTIDGRLTADAEVRLTAGDAPRALLLVELQTVTGLPYRATQDMGAGFIAHLAATGKAKRLRKGDLCVVACDGLRVRTDENRPALQCLGVWSITEKYPVKNVFQAMEESKHA